VVEACEAVGIGRASYYRALHPTPAVPAPQRLPPLRSLPAAERERVRQVLLSERFVDKAVQQVEERWCTQTGLDRRFVTWTSVWSSQVVSIGLKLSCSARRRP